MHAPCEAMADADVTVSMQDYMRYAKTVARMIQLGQYARAL